MNMNAPASVLLDKPFPVKRPLLIWVALSDRMEEPRRIFTADSAQPGMPSGV